MSNNPLTQEELLALVGAPPAPPPQELPQGEPDIEPGWLYRNLKEYYHFDLERQPHAWMIDPVERALGDCSFSSGGQKLIMIGVPRGTYKTTIFAQGTPVEVLAHNPNARCLIDSYRHSVSKRRLKAARRHMELKRDGSAKNPAWVAQYGEDWVPQFREESWSDDAITVMHRTDVTIMEPSIATAGIDRSEVGGHFDFIVGDDLVNDRNCRTPEMRQQVYDHIRDLLPILSPNGVLLLIFTTWDPDDAYARIQKEERERQRRGEPAEWTILIHGAYNADGSLFAPTILSHEKLDALKRRMGSHKFSAQYLLKPVASEDRTFNMDAAREVNFTFQPKQEGGVILVPRWAGEKRPVQTTLAWDPAGVKYNRKSDFHGLSIVGCDPLDTWWILEAAAIKGPPLTSRDRLTGEEIEGVIDAVIRLIVYYHPHTLSCEDVTAQMLWINLLQMEMRKRHLEMPGVYEYKPGNVPKNTRIEMLQPKWERGEIIFKPTMTDLRDQFETFTRASEMRHEDILDSLVHHLFTAIPANPEMLLRDENPLDLEAIMRRSRLEEPRQGGSAATEWDV